MISSVTTDEITLPYTSPLSRPPAAPAEWGLSKILLSFLTPSSVLLLFFFIFLSFLLVSYFSSITTNIFGGLV